MAIDSGDGSVYRLDYQYDEDVTFAGSAGIVGETAALMYTSGTVAKYAGAMESGRTLALHMYVLTSEALHVDQASATAVVLLIIVIGINAFSGFIAKKLAKKTGE